MNENFNPVQKILFGSPGTGKSYQIREIATKQLTLRQITRTILKFLIYSQRAAKTSASCEAKVLALVEIFCFQIAVKQ